MVATTTARKSRAKEQENPLSAIFESTEEYPIFDITPEIAQKLLDMAHNLDMSRDALLDAKAVDIYAQAMAAGNWIMNAQPIVLDEKGIVIDGVQRLAAAVQSGATFRSVVKRGVNSDILHTLDQHRRRNYQGVLESRGIENAGVLVRTMSKLIRIENGVLGKENISISWSRYDRVLKANPELYEAVKLSNSFGKCLLHSTSRPVLCYMAIMAGYKDEVANFLLQLTDNYTEVDMTSAARIFALQLGVWQDMARSARGTGQLGTSAHVDTQLAHAILHFNAYVAGKKLTRPLSWTPHFGTRVLVRKHNGKEVTERVQSSEETFDRKAAPANLGLPVLKGFKGVRDGNFDRSKTIDDLMGDTADEIHKAVASGTGSNVQIRDMEITPDMAARWLDPKINRGNRKTQRNHIAAITRDIKEGRWMMNAQPICFTKDPTKSYPAGEEPRLLNGQHRLMGIREAQEAVEIPIAWNVPEEAFATFDVHAKRTVRHNAGGPKVDDRVLTAAARFQYREDNNIPMSADIPTLTAGEIIEVIQRHPGLQDGFALSRKAGMQALGSAGVMLYFIYRVLREAPEYGAVFLNKIETGLNIISSNDPAGRLRRELHKSARGSRGRSRREQIEALISHWNSYKRWYGNNELLQIEDQSGSSAKREADFEDDLFSGDETTSS